MKKLKSVLFALSFVSVFLIPTAIVAQSVTVGGKGFTEQLVIAEITKQYFEKNGFEVDKKDGLGSTVLRSAQVNGEIDVYWEYTGTSLVTYNKFKEKLNAKETYEKVKSLDAKQGLVWLNPSKANNTYALVVRASNPNTDSIQSLSDLAGAYNAGKKISLAVNAEFPKRPDGLIGLQKLYDFKAGRSNLVSMESGLTYVALKEEKVDVALAFATDGRIAAFNFRLLKDDKGFFPNYALTPVIRKDTLDKYPKLGELLNQISATLSDQIMQTLNARVDVDKVSVKNVAEEFIQNNL